MNMHPNGLGLERASVVEIVQGTDEVLLWFFVCQNFVCSFMEQAS